MSKNLYILSLEQPGCAKAIKDIYSNCVISHQTKLELLSSYHLSEKDGF